MKKNIFFVAFVCCALTQSVFFASCGNKFQKAKPTAQQLFNSIQREATNAEVKEFSEAMADTIEMYMDSAFAVTSNRQSSIDDVVLTKAKCLFVMGKMLEKGGKLDAERIKRFTEKNLDVQFGFTVSENEGQYCMNLANVFLPENHETDMVADFFDFYAYFDKQTKECSGMLCDLPRVFSNPDKQPLVLAYVKKNSMSEDMEELEVSMPEYDEKYATWTVTIPGSQFEKIMQNGNIYFFATDNDEEGVETSTINLTSFKKQYAELKAKGKATAK